MGWTRGLDWCNRVWCVVCIFCSYILGVITAFPCANLRVFRKYSLVCSFIIYNIHIYLYTYIVNIIARSPLDAHNILIYLVIFENILDDFIFKFEVFFLAISAK